MTRMPAHNRVSGSGALKTNDMWSKTIGHDPYASSADQTTEASSEQFEGLKFLAKIQNAGGGSRGGCKKCGMLGHLTFQCRNEEKAAKKDSDSSDSYSSEDDEVVPAPSTQIISSESSRKEKKEKKDEKKGSKRDRDPSDEERKSKKSKKEKKHKKVCTLACYAHIIYFRSQCVINVHEWFMCVEAQKGEKAPLIISLSALDWIGLQMCIKYM